MAKIPRTRIAQVIAQRSLNASNTEQFSREIAAYLLESGRVDELDSVLRDVMQYRADQGIVEVIAHAAHPVSATVRVDIEAETKKLYPAAKTIIISEQLDTDLVGGVRLEYANQQLDLSVRAQLNRFKQLTAA